MKNPYITATKSLRKSIRGVTLLEVLIAILVLSFGLLGMLGFLLNSLKLSSTSSYRTIAGEQAYTMAESLRANPSMLVSFAAPSTTITAACMTATGCTAAQFVNTQFGLWTAQLGASLPSGSGTVCQDSTSAVPTISGGTINWHCDNTQQFVIKICWDDSRVATSSNFQCTQTSL